MTRSQLVITMASALAACVVIVLAARRPAAPPIPRQLLALRRTSVIHVPLPASAPAPTPTAPPAPAPAQTVSPASSPAPPTGASGASPPAAPAAPAPARPEPVSATAPAITRTTPVTKKQAPTLPSYPVKHVWLITLATPSYADAFSDASTAKYLRTTLRPDGLLLTHYSSLTGARVPDELALLSGQPPTRASRAGCVTYGEASSPGGCIFPEATLTLPDQLDTKALPWRAYVDGMSKPCEHPDEGAPDAPQGSGYSPVENPIIFFHSLLDLGDCQSNDLPLTRLQGDLQAVSSTPAFSLVAPDPCDAGETDSAAPCPTGTTAGPPAADAFLERVVPPILASPAYRKDGLLIIALTPEGSAPGPARTGALVLSRFIRPGRTVSSPTGPYVLLRLVEELFGLPPIAQTGHAQRLAKVLLGSAA